MSLVLVAAITVVAVLLALLGGAAMLARRRIGLVHVGGAVLLEVLLLVQAGAAVVAMVGGERPVETATFLGYLVGVLLVPVAGVLWARTEPTRWAGGVIVVAGIVVAVMAWRLLQLWEATRA
ncbi:MAG: putative integral rane protein [Blastococcus sp.]|nr:putative integral rane protein [Blastococcus sp.]